MTQCDLLFIVTYGIGILPLIHYMKTVIQAPNQPWYVDNAAIMVLWGLIVDYFTALTNHGPRFVFYPEPEKLIVVVKESQEDDAT